MEDKVLCGCHNVTLEQVKKQISEGVSTFEELQKNTNIGTDCPPCKEDNLILFNQLIKEK
jgi:bacterioferritin-associated ferredoxin